MGRANKRKNCGFKSLKQKERLGKISSSISKRWGDIYRSLDHSYFGDHFGTDDDTSADTIDLHVPDIGDIGDDIVINETESRLDIDWGKGRRIIELDVLAEGLRACRSCGVPLHLSHATGITTFGLASVIKGTGL